MAVSYTFNPKWGADILCKSKKTGKPNPIVFIYFLPFYLFLWSTWALKHIIACEDPYNMSYETQDGKRIWIGRYPVFGIPDECDIVVDCTVEYPGIWLSDRVYFNVPSLDMVLATPEEFRKAAEDIIQEFKNGKKSAFIHCANGHGRSGLMAALVIVLLGEIETIGECRTKLKEKRTVINWQPNQEAVVEEALKIKGKSQLELEDLPTKLDKLASTGSLIEVQDGSVTRQYVETPRGRQYAASII